MAKSKKEKEVKAYTFKPRKEEDNRIIEFIETQSNLNDTIRYLIEKEVYTNGIRDIVKYIPAMRDEEYFNFNNEELCSRPINVNKNTEVKSIKKESEDPGIRSAAIDIKSIQVESMDPGTKSMDKEISVDEDTEIKSEEVQEDIQGDIREVEEVSVDRENTEIEIPECYL